MADEFPRRTLVELVGGLAGAAAVHSTLNAMGLLVTPTAYAAPPPLPLGSGDGKSVLILGAGIAGMTAAYRLGKAGYQCRILEARSRSGGRVWTIRSGDRIEEIETVQRVEWENHRDLYFNAGAARISSHHHGILGYCRELGVPLELFANDNRAALVQFDSQFEGKPQVARRLLADMRGGIAALAAKSTASNGPLQALLRVFGDLKPDLSYAGSSRAGYAGEDDAPGGGTQSGRIQQPLAIGEIAGEAARQTALALCFTESWQQSPTMLQPVDGMDAIVRAFDRALDGVIQHDEVVTRIERIGERGRVTSLNRKTGRSSALEADFVICTIPLPVLTSIPADFPVPVKEAIALAARGYFPAVKVAFEAPRRWWETDRQIYGGISWTGRDITQVWYPSHGFHGRKGVLIGAYIWDYRPALRFTNLSPGERAEAAISDGEKLHPGYATLVGAPASVAWRNIPYSLGAWMEWAAVPGGRDAVYPTLLAGDGPFYFAGEHMSYVTAWMEGAVQSAHHTIAQIAQRVGASRR